MIVVNMDNVNYLLILMTILLAVVGIYFLVKHAIQYFQNKNKETLEEILDLQDMRNSIDKDIEIPLPKQYGQNNKYLNDIGVSLNYGISEDDSRQDEWRKEREIYGFDERDTWGLDSTMIMLLYERVKYFVEFAPVDLTSNKITIDEETKTLEEWLSTLTNVCEKYLSQESTRMDKIYDYQFEIWTIWRSVSGFMWW